MTPRAEIALASGLVAAGLLVRLALGASLPPFQAPDERAHFDYVRHLGEGRGLPVQPAPGPELLAGGLWRQAYQPPLAYLLFVPVDRALAATGVRLGARVRALRAQNALYGALTVLIAYLATAALTPAGDPRRALAAAFVAFLPGLVGSAAAVNNDGLANLLAASFFLVASARPGRPVALGAVLGAAALAKLTVLSLAPLLLLLPWLDGRGPRRALREAAVAGGVAALLLAPWVARNLLVYGDPLAIGVGSIPLSWIAERVPPETLAEAARARPGNVLFQYLGRFGVANNLRLDAIPWLTLPLVGLALAGWGGRALRRAPEADRLERVAPACVAALLLAGAALAWFSLRYVGGWQGRYLYAAAWPAAALFAGGTWRALEGRGGLPAVLAIAALLLALDIGVVLAVRDFYAAQPPAAWILPSRL